MHKWMYIGTTCSICSVTFNDMQRESEALDKVRELERKISEINALVTKERTSNCEMQRVHKGLMKVWYLYFKHILALILIMLHAYIDDMQRESDALVKVRYLENKINEMNDEMNALITKERSSNDELQRVRNELMKVSYPHLKLSL